MLRKHRPPNPAQLSLPTAPYVKHSPTSRAAAESVEPQLARLERVVFGIIVAAGAYGATDDEIEIATKLPHQTASARRRGLVLGAYIRDSGETRPTRSGRKATVWGAASLIP